MIITTAFDETEYLLTQARNLSNEYGLPFVPRQKRTIKSMLETTDPQIFVANSLRGLSYYEKGKQEVFFHPNLAFQRIAQSTNGQSDGLLSACGMEKGMTFFDGTAGLLSDTIVASSIADKVIACEKSFPLFLVLKEGIKFYQRQHPEKSALIDKIELFHSDNLELLQALKDESIDVVYFDFMFEKTIESSIGIQTIKSVASFDKITARHVKESLRVAKKRVIVKSSYGNPLLKALGFKMNLKNKRKRFYYATLEKTTVER